jgi:hypothetical protein
MDGFAILDTVTLPDMLLAAAGGFFLSFGAVLVSGYLPLRSGALPLPEILARALVLTDAGILVLLAGLLAGYIVVGTAWAPALIVAGLAVLAAPPIFQALPRRWAGGLAALLVLLAASGALAAVLAERLLA